MKADHGLYAIQHAPLLELLSLAPWLGETRLGLIHDMVEHESELTTGQQMVLAQILRSAFYAARLGKWIDVFDRYHIVSTDDVAAALTKVGRFVQAAPPTNVVPLRRTAVALTPLPRRPGRPREEGIAP